MKYSKIILRTIYARTDGRCHLCHAKVHFKNYGNQDARGAWEVEHSLARALGGTDHGNNLRPSCVSCNRSKGTAPARTVRRKLGQTRAPLSRGKKVRIQKDNTFIGATAGTVIGMAGGIPGMIVGGIIGGMIGGATKPPKS